MLVDGDMVILPYSVMDDEAGPLKPVVWVRSSKGDYLTFPDEVQNAMGFALYRAQQGRRHPSAKPLKGFGGAGVLELVQDRAGDTYRAIYTVRFTTAVYVLHAFQKRAKKGIATPKPEVDLIRRRLRDAEAIERARSRGAEG
jgi:phage-related protein